MEFSRRQPTGSSASNSSLVAYVLSSSPVCGKWLEHFFAAVGWTKAISGRATLELRHEVEIAELRPMKSIPEENLIGPGL